MAVIVEACLGDWAVERLEAEIAVGSAHLAAAECRWLQLVAEFDRREAWASWDAPAPPTGSTTAAAWPWDRREKKCGWHGDWRSYRW